MKEIINIYGWCQSLVTVGVALVTLLFVCYRIIYRKVRKIDSYYFSDVLVDCISFAVLSSASFVLFCMYDLSVATPSRARQCVESSASSLTFDDFNKWFSGEPEAQALVDPLPEEVVGCVYCFNEAKSAYDYVYCIGSSDHRVTFTIKVDENGSNILEWT